MLHFSPSILSADFVRLGEEIACAEKGGADYLHFDVMDGIFVKSISFGMPVLRCVRAVTDLFLDVHLMVTEPERYIDDFVRCGADLISVHVEAVRDVDAAIKAIRDGGVKVGLAISPETSVEHVRPYIGKIDQVVVMLVHPGFGEQSYLPECAEKIPELKKMIEESGYDVDIEVDGGVKTDNVEHFIDLGANVIVAGSAVFRGNALENAKKFTEILAKKESAK